MAANLWRPAGVNNNYNNALNWSLGAVPTASDGNVATFDNNVLSGPCTINVASQANNVDFSTYNKTLTCTSTLSISGNVTLGINMTFSGTGAWTVNANSTLTSNGKTFPNQLNFNGLLLGFTWTFADSWIVSNLVTTQGSTGGLNYILNSASGTQTLTCNNFTFNGGSTASTTITSGNLPIILKSGTTTMSNGSVQVNISVDAGANTVTFTAFRFTAATTFTWISGTIAGAVIFTYSADVTLDWRTNVGYLPMTIAMSGTHNVFLLSNVYLAGAMTSGAGSPTTFSGAFTFYLSGNLAQATTSTWSPAAGFLGFVITGANSSSTMTWSGAIDSTMKCNMTFNTPGTFTFASGNSLVLGGGMTLTYTAGTAVTTGNTLYVNGNATINIAGMSINNFNTYSSTSIVTLSSNMVCNGNLTWNTPVTFTGTGVWTCNTFGNGGTVASPAMVLVHGQEYTINSGMTLNGTPSGSINIKSDSAGNRAYLTLKYDATQAVGYSLVITDIDSSRGQTIWYFPTSSTVSNTINWNQLTVAAMQKSTSFMY